MQVIWDGLVEALRLLFGGDAEVYQIALRTLWVSGLALCFAVAAGVPLGTVVALNSFRGRRFVVTLINTGMAAPPVVVGLLVALFLTRSGPLGVVPSAVHDLGDGHRPGRDRPADRHGTLAGRSAATGPGPAAADHGPGRRSGAGFLLLLREIRVALLATVMAAFGAVISEVGAVIMVGGNIKGQTQVLTGAIVQETRIGRFSVAIALALILMTLAFGANLALTFIQQQGRRRE